MRHKPYKPIETPSEVMATLEVIRVSRNWSTQKMADALGCTKQAYSQWCKTGKIPAWLDVERDNYDDFIEVLDALLGILKMESLCHYKFNDYLD